MINAMDRKMVLEGLSDGRHRATTRDVPSVALAISETPGSLIPAWHFGALHLQDCNARNVATCQRAL